MKKKIIICVFSVLILVTIVGTVISAIQTYRYEIANYDILEGLGAAILVVVGTFVVLYEADLFWLVYYFFVKPKTATKTVLNLSANLSLILIVAYHQLSGPYEWLRKYEFIPVVLLAIYVAVRIAYFIVAICRADRIEKEITVVTD